MLFPTFTFVVFFLIVWPLNWVLMRNRERWRIFMMAASYVFYAAWDWRFALLLAGSTVINQGFAVAMSRTTQQKRRTALLVATVVVNLGILAYFKYWNFFVDSGQTVLGNLGFEVPSLLVDTVLPVGISFFTFMALSYVIDIYLGDYKPTTISKFAVFLSFFPHLVAGPIVRPAELVPQFDPPPDPRYVDTTRAFALIAGGLFKKVVIATALARFVDPVFGAPDQYSSLVVLVAVYAYAIQIYADFSGYTDMAIGIALLLGFRLPQNFNRPYASSSLREFWRRWHMTLSRWLRDYLYIPLGGNRKGRLRTYINIMLTMLLGGLWHGASWTFVVWGALNGFGLVVDHWWVSRREARGGKEPAASGPRRWGMIFLTFNFVCLAWVFFREDTISGAVQLLGHLFTAWDKPSPQISVGVLLAIVALLLTQFSPPRIGEQLRGVFSQISPIAQGAVLGVTLMLTNLLGPYGVAPFIYFQF